MVRVYLSSTFRDLQRYREAAYRALRRLGHDVVAMEDYVATDERPMDRCLEDVRRADVYIGILAWRCPKDVRQANQRREVVELQK